MAEANVTTDHDTIRRWAEERGARPAAAAGTGRKEVEAGIPRLDFAPVDGEPGRASWDDFFRTFDREKLAFLYQDRTDDGSVSRYHKFVSRAPAGRR